MSKSRKSHLLKIKTKRLLIDGAFQCQAVPVESKCRCCDQKHRYTKCGQVVRDDTIIAEAKPACGTCASIASGRHGILDVDHDNWFT